MGDNERNADTYGVSCQTATRQLSDDIDTAGSLHYSRYHPGQRVCCTHGNRKANRSQPIFRHQLFITFYKCSSTSEYLKSD